MKEFADDNFKFDENGSKLSKWVEKLWEKEKLLVTSNFSFSHSVFKRLVFQGRQKGVIVWEWVKYSNTMLVIVCKSKVKSKWYYNFK